MAIFNCYVSSPEGRICRIWKVDESRQHPTDAAVRAITRARLQGVRPPARKRRQSAAGWPNGSREGNPMGNPMGTPNKNIKKREERLRLRKFAKIHGFHGFSMLFFKFPPNKTRFCDWLGARCSQDPEARALRKRQLLACDLGLDPAIQRQSQRVLWIEMVGPRAMKK